MTLSRCSGGEKQTGCYSMSVHTALYQNTTYHQFAVSITGDGDEMVCGYITFSHFTQTY